MKTKEYNYDHYSTDPEKDPGDRYDAVKWVFDESQMVVLYHEGYPYKLNKTNNTDTCLKKLISVRNFTNKLANALNKIKKNDVNCILSKDIINKINVFLYIHLERPVNNPAEYPEVFRTRILKYGSCSRFLLSNIPSVKKSPFAGLNMPKNRYISVDSDEIGKDGKLRCEYRDVFLDSSEIDKRLVLHELSHTFANHVRYYDDNHHADFKECEDILKEVDRQLHLKL
jgi:hypothetical protein